MTVNIIIPEDLKELTKKMGEDMRNGTMMGKIEKDPDYPFSLLHQFHRHPDVLYIEKTPKEVNVLFIIILVLSILLFYFAFMR